MRLRTSTPRWVRAAEIARAPAPGSTRSRTPALRRGRETCETTAGRTCRRQNVEAWRSRPARRRTLDHVPRQPDLLRDRLGLEDAAGGAPVCRRRDVGDVAGTAHL